MLPSEVGFSFEVVLGFREPESLVDRPDSGARASASESVAEAIPLIGPAVSLRHVICD